MPEPVLFRDASKQQFRVEARPESFKFTDDAEREVLVVESVSRDPEDLWLDRDSATVLRDAINAWLAEQGQEGGSDADAS